MVMTRFTQYLEDKVTQSKILFSGLLRCYMKVIKNEAELAGIDKDDHVLFIGGGAAPCSAIAMQKLTGAKVTVIDNDRDCIRKSKALAKKMNFSKDMIKIKHMEGEFVDAGDYSVIHLALQVSPKEKVLDRVYKTMKPNTRVLVRHPKESRKCFYDVNLRKRCSECSMVEHKNFTNIQATAMYL
ncbi:nicotianamine synthase family protein [Alkalibacter saccharofermentans]|uniref:Nicotianamine synthase protein n=1 Tax=Alkalibacter saccharofermentans DSM 14828 TaxID=1120975 RepID=A0A1M4VZ06_9FIRM|nr:nicotianamine synthase family protein [Alkalibacter saccharofermentans]SHE74135.1 Nicotianamine synthase protein [Alkalibacter saccharofermentans DSM 14828]